MPVIPIQKLPDDARIWIFGISPHLDEEQSSMVLSQIDTFLTGWAAHGSPITSGRELIEGTFLVIAIDRASEASGCSIDRMFSLLQKLESEYEVQILDPDRVFFRHGSGQPDMLSRAEFARKADPHTIVFDHLAERLGEVRSGHWERHVEDSWHSQLLA